MRFGLDVCILGEYADPALVADLARDAEAAGWEALFVWDHLAFAWGVPAADPWITLAAVATATSRMILGPAVTPVPRRRPAVLAQQVATLDRLSAGRVVFGAGLGGVAAEYTAFGESGADTGHARQLDEALPLLAGLWSGKKVTHRGKHYTVDGVTLAPGPVHGRIPIWIGGMSRAALRRAARWDGWIGGGDEESGRMALAPDEVGRMVAYLHRHRDSAAPFEVALTAAGDPADHDTPARYAAAGVTWWLEHIHSRRGSLAHLRERIAAGPPAP